MPYALFFLVNILLIQGLDALLLYRQKRVVGGENVGLGEYPYQVSIQNVESSLHHCGGTIINNYHVLTAAHCLYKLDPEDFKVISGTVDLNKPKYTNYVTKLYVHDGFDESDSWKHDIALLRVSKPFKFDELIKPAILSNYDEEIYPNEITSVSGFGRTKSHTNPSKILKKVEVPVISLDECNNFFMKNHLNITDLQICTEGSQSKGICKGDSGGPLTVNGKAVGVSSFTNDGCTDAKYPSVYTKISKYLYWIQFQIIKSNLEHPCN